MSLKMRISIFLVLLVSPLFVFKAGATHGNNDMNLMYNLRIYQCNDDSPEERKRIVEASGGIEKFAIDRVGTASISYGKYKVEPKYLYENCLFVFGKPTDVPGNEYKVGYNGIRQPLYLGFTHKGTPYPNPAYPEWFAFGTDVLKDSRFVWYEKPWERPWGNFAPFDDIVGKWQDHTNSNRIQQLSRAIDKYSPYSGNGNFRTKHPQERSAWISADTDASVLSRYADVINLGDDWTAGTFTLYFKHTQGHRSTLYGYSTFFIPPKKNPFENTGNVKALLDVPSVIYHEEEFTFQSNILNDMNRAITVNCSTNNSKVVPCRYNDTWTQTWNFSVKQGHNATWDDWRIVRDGQVNATRPMTISPKTNTANTGQTGRNGLSLPVGQYTIWVKAPDYTGENDKWDNYVSRNITVKPVDLELLDKFNITPKAAQKSDEPIQKMEIQVRNNTDKALTNVEIDYYWETEQNVKMCESIPRIGANQTITVTLGAGLNNLCTGETKKPSTDYPRYEQLTREHTTSLVVHVNPDRRIKETDYTNNERKFPVRVLGLNALINRNQIDVGTRYNGVTDVTIQTHIENNMRKDLYAPCSTSLSVGEICKYSNQNRTVEYILYDTNWTEEVEDDILVHSWTKTHGAIKENEIALTTESQLSLPNGRYRLVTKIPHYKWEYNYTDNTLTDHFRIGLEEFGHNQSCSMVSPTYVSEGIAKMCLSMYPKFPSTEIEEGQNTHFFVKYRLFPTPMPPYTIKTYNVQEPFANGFRQDYNLNESKYSNGNTNTFLYYNNQGVRGRLFPEEVNISFKVINPSGVEIPRAVGEVMYSVPKRCIQTSQLDFKDSKDCRELNFYLPYTGNLADQRGIPEEKDRLSFKDPGLYRLEIEVKEKQVFYSQRKIYFYDEDGYVIDWEWSAVRKMDNFRQTNSDWRYNFSNPTVNFTPPSYLYRNDDVASINNLYEYFLEFTVSGLSSASSSTK